MVIEFFNQLIEVQPRVADNLYLVLTQMDQQDIPVLEYSTYAYRSKFIVKEQFNGFVAGMGNKIPILALSCDITQLQHHA